MVLNSANRLRMLLYGTDYTAEKQDNELMAGSDMQEIAKEISLQVDQTRRNC